VLSTNSFLILLSRAIPLFCQLVILSTLLSRLPLAAVGTLGFLQSFGLLTRQMGELGQDLGLTRGLAGADGPRTGLLAASLLSRFVAGSAVTLILLWPAAHFAPGQLDTYFILQTDSLLFLLYSAIFASYRAHDEIRPEGLALSTGALVTLALTWIYGASPASFAACALAGSLATLALALLNPWQGAMHFHPGAALGQLWEIVQGSMALAICAACGSFYIRAGSAVLYLLNGPSAAGAYDAVQRLLLAVGLIPGAVALATYPSLCRLSGRDARGFGVLLQEALDPVVCLSVPAALGFALVVPDALDLLMGPKSIALIPVARALGASLLFTFGGTILGYSVLAGSNLRRFIHIWIQSILVHVVLAVAAVRMEWGATGVATATLCSDALINLRFLWLVRAESRDLTVWRGFLRGTAYAGLLGLYWWMTASRGRGLSWTGMLAISLLMGVRELTQIGRSHAGRNASAIPSS
jgi:O-antigen/teichoic acid export membrane protein